MIPEILGDCHHTEVFVHPCREKMYCQPLTTDRKPISRQWQLALESRVENNTNL